MPAPLADLLPRAEDFVLALLRRVSESPVTWVEINRLAAHWLRPLDGDTSRAGHTIALQMSHVGLLAVESSSARDGSAVILRACAVRSPAPVVSERLAA